MTPMIFPANCKGGIPTSTVGVVSSVDHQYNGHFPYDPWWTNLSRGSWTSENYFTSSSGVKRLRKASLYGIEDVTNLEIFLSLFEKKMLFFSNTK